MAEEQSTAEHGFEGASPAAVAPKSSVVRLRGLPFSSGEEEVRQFFSDFNVAQVVVCRRGGRSTGEGYVQLDSIAAAADAIAKLNRATLGHRYIEVFESNEADLTTAKSSNLDRQRGFVVRCRGLPYTATAQDVLNFFGTDVPVVRGMEGVVFTYAPDGRPTGEAFIELQSEDAQREALKKHKETIGSRYVELFVSTKVDMIQAIQQNRLILGYGNRKRWLQQQGVGMAPGMGMGHPGMGHHYGPHGGRGRHHQYGGVDEVTDMMGGFNMGGHVQVIGPGGTILPPGTYHLEVSRDVLSGKGGARFAYPGRGGRGGRGPYPGGRGPAMGMGGRGMQGGQGVRPVYNNRPPMGMAPAPPAPARQAGQMMPGGSAPGQGQGGAGSAGAGAQQQQQQQQQQQMVPEVVAQQGGAGGGYMLQQQPGMAPQYDQQQQWGGQPMMQQQAAAAQAGLYAGAQQPGGIQGVAPGYGLGMQVPGGAVQHGGYDYSGQQVVHGLQGLDGAAVQAAGGLQGAWGPR